MSLTSGLIRLALVVLLAVSGFAATLTVASKGKKEQPQVYSGHVVAFDGTILAFAVAGEPTPRKFSADSTSMTIDLKVVANATLLDQGQSPIRPGRIASSVDAATKDTDLQQAQLQHSSSSQPPENNATAIDLLSCHGRGQDSLSTSVGFSTKEVGGKILKISNGVLFLQETPQKTQQFNLDEEVAVVSIGNCN